MRKTTLALADICWSLEKIGVDISGDADFAMIGYGIGGG